MPGFSNKQVQAALALVTVLLATAGAGTNWLFVKQTPNGASATRNIACWKSGSGTGVCIHENGSIVASGSIVANGVTLGGGGSSSTGTIVLIGDARYLKRSGGTMTGALNVRATLSGTQLVIDRNANISGALLVVGASATRGILSGTTLTIQRSGTVSGSLLVKGNLYTKSNFSGALITIMAGGTSYNLGSEAIGKTTVANGAKLDVVGIVSGSTLTISSSASLSGTVIVKNTLATKGILSGATLMIQNSGTVSGALLVKGLLATHGTVSGAFLTVQRSVTMSGALSVKTGIATKGYFSGATIFSFGLGSCSNTSTSKLLYNNATGLFSCGTDQSGGGGVAFTALKTTNYTASCGDSVPTDSRGASLNVTLPAASADCKVTVTMNFNNASNTVFIKSNGGTNNILDRWSASGATAASYTGSVVGYGTGDTLALQNDGTNWHIMADNRIKMSASMRLTGSLLTPNATDTKVPVTVITADIGGMSDVANRRMNVRRAGMYFIQGTCPYHLDANSTSVIKCELWKNGVKMQQVIQETPTTGRPQEPSVMWQTWLNKGDYIELYAYSDANQTMSDTANEIANLTMFEIR